MPDWTKDELTRIGQSEEVDIAPLRRDGTLRNRVTIWLVRSGDNLFIRSAVRGRSAAWFRGVQETHLGRIWADRIEKDVGFVNADPALNDEVDAAYRAKYRRYRGRILESCLTPEARSTTLRLTPRMKGS